MVPNAFTAKEFLTVLLLIPILDAPWLFYTSQTASGMFQQIQGGRPTQFRILAAIPVYIALAYLLLQQTSAVGAFLSGLCVYAIYDFTNLLVFRDYTLSFAIQDSIWGGVLFFLAYVIFKRVKKVFLE